MYQQTVTPQTKPRRKGGRRPKNETNDFQVLSEEDRLKRDQKRERNKKAAARSRQKQIEKIEGLKQEKEKLQQQNIQLRMREKILEEAMEKVHNLQSSFFCHPCSVEASNMMKILEDVETALNTSKEQQQETTQSSINNQSSGTLLPKSENIDEPQQQKKDQQKQQHQSFPQNNIISDYSSSTLLPPSDSIVEPQQQQKQNQEQQQFIPQSINNNQFSSTYLPPIAFLRPPKIEGQNPCVAEAPPQRPTTLSLFSAFESETPSGSYELFKKCFPEY